MHVAGALKSAPHPAWAPLLTPTPLGSLGQAHTTCLSQFFKILYSRDNSMTVVKIKFMVSPQTKTSDPQTPFMVSVTVVWEGVNICSQVHFRHDLYSQLCQRYEE